MCSALQWMLRKWILFHGKDEALRLISWNNSDPHLSNVLANVIMYGNASVPCWMILYTFLHRVNTSKGYTRSDLVKQLESLHVLSFFLLHLFY
jgi:16S rRNA (cytosine967-C5)-methyltransferase